MNKIFILFVFLIFLSPASFCLEYDYSSTEKIPIRVMITQDISTKMPIAEGQKLNFRVINDVRAQDISLKRGDIIEGEIECIITRGMNGFPAEIILGGFKIPNVKNTKLISEYTKAGRNRCYWVFPLKWALTMLFPLGTLTNFIRGGHAKITSDDIITLYYYPEWK